MVTQEEGSQGKGGRGGMAARALYISFTRILEVKIDRGVVYEKADSW